ncbi:MAG: glutathione S-transferase family protein [Pseudomonadota bacterium]
MSSLTLIIGNKKYSSWSLRPWLVMKTLGIPFTERLETFDHSTNHAHFRAFSPSKKVPVLQHETLTIWDSLAMCEYLAELFPQHALWPNDRTQRAVARSVANEMHSGFLALRTECPVNFARPVGALALSDDCHRDIKRIESLIDDCYASHQDDYLFGTFGIADAMLAPVVNRVRTYALTRHPAVMRFCDAIEALPAWQQWAKDGADEPWVCDIVEF